MAGGAALRKLREGVISIDSFPITLMLTYNNDTSYKTLLGGICSIIMFCFIGLLFIILTIRLASKSDISVNYLQKPVQSGITDLEEHDIKADGKKIGLVLTGIGETVDHRRVFDVFFESIDTTLNETTGEYENEYYRYFTEKCTSDDFHDYSMSSSDLAHSYWIK